MNTARFPYEAFNARNLTPEEVADSFVPPEEFRELCKNTHTLLMGPRGSGKTTLLKMLTLPALYSWRHEQAAPTREAIRFTAVYIPTDIHWHHQLAHARARIEQFPDLLQRISEVAVTTNVLSAVCASMAQAIRYQAVAAPIQEAAVCEVLIREWRLPPTIPSLTAINESLRSRINDLYIQIDKLTKMPPAGSMVIDYPEHFSLDYLAAANVACTAFDRIMPPHTDRKWALCFDELELAPEWLQQRLFVELRSTDERFLFKLSTSPIPKLIVATEARAGHDFAVVRLWPHQKNDPRRFCERLVSTILRRQGVTISPDELFGRAPLASEDDPKEYAHGSEIWRIMREWAQVDADFRAVLEEVGISSDDPTTAVVDKRDRILRKAKPVVLIRHAFLKRDRNGNLIQRSRKLAAIYCGKDTIYDMSEGNPRLLIGIVNDMLWEYQRRVASRRIDPRVQARVLASASRRFGAFIRSLPQTAVVTGDLVQLYDLIECIGDYFFEAIALRPFTLDPVGSFSIDRGVATELQPMLRSGVYNGALVLVDAADDPFDADLIGKRFRLSYILAPTFGLPLRLYGPVGLSNFLRGRLGGRARSKQQESLFGDQQ